MKKTNALYLGNEPGWVMQSKRHESGRVAADWSQLETNKGQPVARPHLHTYGHTAEKWDHSGRSFVPERPMVSRVPPPPPSRTWGIEGDMPSGKGFAAPLPAQEQHVSSKRVLPPRFSGSHGLEDVMARKAHVRDASGRDVRNAFSAEFRLEDVMARKAKVSEADRTAPRTIDRVAPPGLKGFIGAEYSPGFYAQDGVVVRQRLRPSRADMQLMELEAAMARAARLGVPLSFAEKKREAALQAERQLVSTLHVPYDPLSDDETHAQRN
jgi:hypothetical protein